MRVVLGGQQTSERRGCSGETLARAELTLVEGKGYGKTAILARPTSGVLVTSAWPTRPALERIGTAF